MEALASSPFVGLLFIFIFLGAVSWNRKMTRKQRNWVVRRDGNRCQKMRFVNGGWVQCERKDNLHVHHIFPKKGMEEWMPHLDPHTPDNLLTLCDTHHVSEDGVHPDIAYAKKDWRRGDKQAFARTFEERELMLKRGKPYWNTLWDLLFKRRAERNTRLYQEKNPGDKFPKTRRYSDKKRR